jgi:hypothetical protein
MDTTKYQWQITKLSTLNNKYYQHHETVVGRKTNNNIIETKENEFTLASSFSGWVGTNVIIGNQYSIKGWHGQVRLLLLFLVKKLTGNDWTWMVEVKQQYIRNNDQLIEVLEPEWESTERDISSDEH